MKNRVMSIVLTLILVIGAGTVPPMSVRGAGKSVVGVRSARMYQSGQWIYYVSNYGNGDGIFRYNTKTKKKTMIHSRVMGNDSHAGNDILADSLLVDGKYVYVFGFIYDDEYDRSCAYRMNRDGSGKKLLFKGKTKSSNLLKSGNYIYLESTKENYYYKMPSKGGKRKKVKINFKIKSSSSTDCVNPSSEDKTILKTGKLKYSVSTNKKDLFRGGKKIYSCSGSEFIYDISVHKKSVYVVIAKTNYSKFTSYYMNSNGKCVKKLNSGCMAG